MSGPERGIHSIPSSLSNKGCHMQAVFLGGAMKTCIWRYTAIVQAFFLPLAVNVARALGGEYDPDSQKASDQLSEVIVTAQKREQNLQQVPISAEVVSSRVLAEQNQNTLQDLTQTVPSVHVDTGGIASDLFIRGVGSGSNSAFDQSVATFVDDIYHGRSRMTGATFLDLDRIEVLKGPQSIFFGNDAIAGALNIVTKKPGDSFDAWGRLLYGQYGQYAVEGAVGGPLSDVFGARLALTRNGSGGWIDTVNLDEQKVPTVDNQAVRLTLNYDPIEALAAILKIEGSRNRTSGSLGGLPLQWNDCPAPPPVGTKFNTNCPQALALGVPMGLDNNLNTGLAGQYQELTSVEDVLTITYAKWDHTLTSVTGYYNYHFHADWDQGNLPIETAATQLPESYHQFSQELRIASPTDQPVEYQAGGYFQTDQLGFLAETNLPSLGNLGAPFFDPFLPLAVLNGFSQHEDVYSLFGSVSWNATDRLKITAGIRGSRDDKADTGHLHYGTGKEVYGGFTELPPEIEPLLSGIFGPPGDDQHLSRSDKHWMPSAGFQYQIVPEVMAYLTYNKGFKAGGLNGENGLAAPGVRNEYGPESVNAYELGLKSKLLNDRVLVNVDVFRSNYKDLQVNTLIYNSVLSAYEDEIGNAAASRSQGVELETQWLVSGEFRLGANVAYLNSYYLSYPEAPPTTLAQFGGAASSNLTGKPTQFAPHWSGSIVASYSLLLPGDYKVTAQLSPYVTSSYYTSSDDPFFLVGGYVRLDGRLTLAKTDSRWAIDVIAKNMTDRIIVAVPGVYNEAKEEPRNVAAQLRYRF
jgi:iron complex outermembrane receptor protein